MTGSLDQAMGRRKRLAPVSVRLSAEERILLERRAGGLPLSTYMKHVLFADGAPSYRAAPKRVSLDHAQLAKLLAWLGQTQMATHLAILAQAAESGSLALSDPVLTQLTKACDDIRSMRETIMQAMGKQASDQPLQSSDFLIAESITPDSAALRSSKPRVSVSAAYAVQPSEDRT